MFASNTQFPLDVLFATGDVIAQQAVEKKGLDKHDPSRTGRMFAYGGLVFGPAATKWYTFLANRVSLSTTNRTIAARVLCDQFIFAPVNMTCFLSSMAYLEGSPVKDKLSKAWVPGMTNNFLLWPWVQAVNFKFVPLEHRVLVVNFVALGWNCYLSYLNSSGSTERGTVEKIEDAESKAENKIKKEI
ncbi:Protein required for ethanol metabolism [Paraconiothyrium brasiliense]|uniref:Protein required for ethanol metabolism n=1 Tax=Paraconiothyrium brasiliense TaxID=300254 RepID=A0ABR3S845_9PLEO